MQVEVACVESRVPGPGDAQDAVGVRLVVAAQATRLMDQPHELRDAGVEQPGVLGVGDEQGRGALRDDPAQPVQVGVSVRVRADGDDPIPGGAGTGRVRGVREDGRDDLVAVMLSARGVIRPDHRDVGVDRRRPGAWLE